MDILNKPGTKDDPTRLMATDRLAFVCKADADPQRVLQNVTAILDAKRVPLAITREQKDAYEQSRIYTPLVNGQEHAVRMLTLATQHKEGAERLVTEADVMQSVLALDEALRDEKSALASDVIAVSPNWLVMSGPPEQSAFGGPGARPSQLADVSQTPPYHLHFYPHNPDATANQELETLLTNASASNVTIVVLDTSPDADEFATRASEGDNELMTGLAQCLTIHTDPAIDAELLPFSQPATRVYTHGHDYNMVSHGIFVAGLIHSIIPNAQIHLIRVLDQQGVGTVNTVNRGLELATTLQTAGVPIIINMSLTLAFPDADVEENEALPPWLRDWTALWTALKTEQEQRLSFLEGYRSETRDERFGLSLPQTLVERMRYALELAVRTAYNQGALIVGAAGNERQPGDVNIPMTQYPAAFDDVVGVGALESIAPNDDPSTIQTMPFAPYSCRVDKIAEEGFAVLGGNVTTGSTPLEADPDKGVVGLWMDASGAADRCWRRWAGTSFAAPIMTGALAMLLAQGKSREDALQMLYDGWPETMLTPDRPNTPQYVLVRQE